MLLLHPLTLTQRRSYLVEYIVTSSCLRFPASASSASPSLSHNRVYEIRHDSSATALRRLEEELLTTVMRTTKDPVHLTQQHTEEANVVLRPGLKQPFLKEQVN